MVQIDLVHVSPPAPAFTRHSPDSFFWISATFLSTSDSRCPAATHLALTAAAKSAKASLRLNRASSMTPRIVRSALASSLLRPDKPQQRSASYTRAQPKHNLVPSKPALQMKCPYAVSSSTREAPRNQQAPSPPNQGRTVNGAPLTGISIAAEVRAPLHKRGTFVGARRHGVAAHR